MNKFFLDGFFDKKTNFKHSDKSIVLNSFIEQSTDLKFLQVTNKYLSMIIITDKSYFVAEKIYKDGNLHSWSAVEIYKEQKITNVNYNDIKDKVLKHMLDNLFNRDMFLKRLRSDDINYYCWQEKYE